MTVSTRRFGRMTLVFCSCHRARYGHTSTVDLHYTGWVFWKR